METTRINKLLSEWGICSRREADRMIEAGRLSVNGIKAFKGCPVSPGDTVCLDGRRIEAPKGRDPVIIAYNKPPGVICTTADTLSGNDIISRIGYKSRIFPVGRLDMDSSGLILLTDMGALVNLINKAGYFHEKEYTVRCRDRIGKEFLKQMSEGVEISVPDRVRNTSEKRTYHREVTRPCKVRAIDDRSFSIILTQGLNRQIRRMCEALGNRVISLRRTRIMNIRLGSLPEGKWRQVTGDELKELLLLAETGEKQNL